MTGAPLSNPHRGDTAFLPGGWDAIRRGDAASAVRLLQAALACNPGDAQAWHGLGVLCAQSGDLTGAFVRLGRAIQLAPEDVEIRQNTAVVVGRLAAATTAGSATPSNDEVLAGLIGQFGRLDHCLRFLHLRITLFGQAITPSYFIGCLLLKLGWPEAAERHFLNALEMCRAQQPGSFRDFQITVAGALEGYDRTEFVLSNCVFDLRRDIVFTHDDSSVVRVPRTVEPAPAGGPRIVECFMFYNEADVLEIKLSEHFDQVDLFVVAEGTRSFSGEPRQPVFPQLQERFRPWLGKFRFLPVDLPVTSHPFEAETLLRNSLMHGLTGLSDEDFVIVDDPDEILRASTLAQLRRDLADPALEIAAFRVPVFWHRLNYLCIDTPEQLRVDFIPQPTYPVGARWGYLKTITPTTLRHKRNYLSLLDHSRNPRGTRAVRLYYHAGWHFSFLGSKDDLIGKMKNYGHPELYDPEKLASVDVDALIGSGQNFLAGSQAAAFRGWQFRRVPVDDNLPKIIRERPEKWASLIG